MKAIEIFGGPHDGLKLLAKAELTEIVLEHTWNEQTEEPLTERYIYREILRWSRDGDRRIFEWSELAAQAAKQGVAG